MTREERLARQRAEQQNRRYILEQAQRYKRLFGTDDGKWVLADLRAEFAERTSFDPTNVHRTAFQEGQRHVLLTIQLRIDYDTKPLIAAITAHEEGE
jgi:hypothetical protein